ncbi:MAG: hypothetical protein ACMXYB_00815 [Candidatus Woesearchaeota archaeon]
MLIYVTAIGSGYSAKTPIGDKKYEGVVGIIEETKQSGKKYKNQAVDQENVFDLLYADTNFTLIEKCVIKSDLSIYHKSKLLLDLFQLIIKKHPKAKFHIELSQGYKELGHILTIIARLMYKHIEKITFLRYDTSIVKFPNSEFAISKEKFDVLKGFYEGTKDSHFNGKIATNKYMHSGEKHRKYIYAVLKWCKEQGILDDKNYVTDFGKILIEYSGLVVKK